MRRKFTIYNLQARRAKLCLFTIPRKLKNYTFLIHNSKFHALHGFTLIELLVSLSIISLLFFGGLAAYREFSTRQQLVEAAKLLSQDLFLAQQRAASGNKPQGCSGILNGYALSFTTNSSYQVVADCGNLGLEGADPVVKTINLSPGITSLGPTSVTFKVLARGITGGVTTFTLRQSSTGRSTTVTVSKEGSIY